MAKIKSIRYRLMDCGKSPFRYKVQIRGFLGLWWNTVKLTANKYSLDTEFEADYWVRKQYPKYYLIKKSTKKK